MRLVPTLFPLLTFCSLVAGRMATPHRRAIDTCANIDIKLNALGLLGVQVSVCACLGGVDALIAENTSLLGATKTSSVGGVKAMVQAAIHSGRGKCTCTYPDYAIPSCSSTNLCDFKCPRDRFKVNGQCVCPPNKHDCNGKCISGPCSSQRPNPYCSVCQKRDELANHQLSRKNKRHGHGTPNWTRRSLSAAHCPPGTEMCGVLGRPDAWECLSVDEDLESCGGCAFPFFPGQEPGVDCSVLPGVEVVSCRKGLCDVSQCALGWSVSADGHSCELKGQVQSRDLNSSNGSSAGGTGASNEGSSEVNGFAVRPW